MLWIETKTDKEAQDLRDAIWNPVVSVELDGTMMARSPGPVEPSGEFWYDTLQREKADPARRYEIARRHLPLPAAWREMAVALRAIIREARKAGGEFEDQLRELHQLAAIWSFGAPAPSGRAGAGYRVIEMTPYATLAGLDLRWETVGCDQLSLLNQTDRKLMREVWGEPVQHSTAHLIYRELFDTQARKIAAAEERHQRRFRAEIDAILKAGSAAPALEIAQTPPRQRSGFFAWLFGRH